MKNNLLITIIAVVIVGGAAFFGGMQYQKSQATTNSIGGQYAQNGQGGGQGRFGMGRRGAMGGATVGKVTSQDANSIMIQLQDGSSKIVNLTNSTTYSKTSTASASDVNTGQNVAAFGSANSDGSITAQNIQINPMIRARQGGTQPTQ